ncbi:MAG: DUF4870 domain-containing protein [Bacteroidales bacterium]|nr:DUF4870 domain-containing protein [Bacteroidales bacterium]
MHFSGIIPLIFPTVLIWNYKKDKIKGMSEHYRDVISFQLKVWVGILACLWIYWKADNSIPLIMIFLGNALFVIFSTFKVVSGDSIKNIFDIKSDIKKLKS